MKKRLLSLLLALIMALSLVPVTAFATDDHDGQVHVTVENTTWTKADGAPWEGTLVDEWVTLKDDSTMMSCIVDALAAKGYTQTGADTGYISEINGIKEKDASKDSGWMGTLNGFFVNLSFAEFTVKKNTSTNIQLADGDVIHVMYTSTGLGEDLGGTFYNSDTTLKALKVMDGDKTVVLAPEFEASAAEPGGTYSYTVMIDDNATELTILADAANKNYLVKRFLNEKVTDNTEGRDFLFPSNQTALELYKQTHGDPVKSEIILNTPIVLYTRSAVAQALVDSGPAVVTNGVYTVDMDKLNETIDAGTTGEDIGLPQLYGSVSVGTNDQTTYNSGNMFAGRLAYTV